MNLLNIVGLVFNLIGTILIVFYIRTDHNEWVENENGQKLGEKWYGLIVKHPRWLIVGVTLIIVGFTFSIVAEICF